MLDLPVKVGGEPCTKAKFSVRRRRWMRDVTIAENLLLELQGCTCPRKRLRGGHPGHVQIFESAILLKNLRRTECNPYGPTEKDSASVGCKAARLHESVYEEGTRDMCRRVF